MKKFLSIMLIFTAMVLVSCNGKKQSMSDKAKTMDHSNVTFHPQTLTTAEAKMGEHVVCPVSGTKIMVTEKTPYADYEGKKIYIAGEENKKKFMADPKSFLMSDMKDKMDDGMKTMDHSKMDM